MRQMLLWAACPVCDETWAELLFDIGLRTQELMQLASEDLGAIVRDHRLGAHTLLPVQIGVEDA